MNSTKGAFVLAVVAIVIAIGTWAYPLKSVPKAGNVVDTSYFDYFDATTGYKLAGNTFYSNVSGTTTVSVGCIQATATSSATNIKLVFSPLGATSTFAGTAYWSYGTCP